MNDVPERLTLTKVLFLKLPLIPCFTSTISFGNLHKPQSLVLVDTYLLCFYKLQVQLNHPHRTISSNGRPPSRDPKAVLSKTECSSRVWSSRRTTHSTRRACASSRKSFTPTSSPTARSAFPFSIRPVMTPRVTKRARKDGVQCKVLKRFGNTLY